MIDPKTKLTPHFTLGEMTASKSHPEIYNVPPLDKVDNLRHLCEWLEDLRHLYNVRYASHPDPAVPPLCLERGSGGEAVPILINSGYRSPMLNRAVGGATRSNHLEGCAADLRCLGPEQALRYAVILMDEMDEARRPFDEIIVERKYNNYWLHFAVRPSNNRRRVLLLEKR